MILKNSLIAASILTGISLVLQTISYVIPGWLFIASSRVDFSLALWYVVLCETKVNVSQRTCGTISYRSLFNDRSASFVSQLQMDYSAIVFKQVEVTSCFLLTIAAFLLMIFQLKTFLSQTPGQPSIYDLEPQDTCSVRSKFFGCGGLAGLCQIISGLLLLMVLYDTVVRHNQLEESQAGEPIVLYIVGTAAGFAILSGLVQIFIIHRTKNKPRQRHEPRHDNPHQTVPLVGLHGPHAQPASANHRPSADLFENPGDYYGPDYDLANPRFHTQGYKHYPSTDLFPGYKLGRQNLAGHDKTWWRKVTCASASFK